MNSIEARNYLRKLRSEAQSEQGAKIDVRLLWQVAEILELEADAFSLRLEILTGEKP